MAKAGQPNSFQEEETGHETTRLEDSPHPGKRTQATTLKLLAS
jgi:hypothetical protein